VVLEAAVKLLANPLFVRMAVVLGAAIVAFVVGIIAFRILRRRIVEDEVFADNLETEAAPFAYSAVIQELKQQKFQLQHEQQEQQRRRKTSEHVSAAVIANLPCGILFISPNGLVRQANAAAKRILGYASPLGMNVDEVFREAKAIRESGTSVKAADVLRNTLHNEIPRGDLEFCYDTPSGYSRWLKLASIPLRTPTGQSLGIACVVTDESALADLRRTELLRSEDSAEVALHLHTSLATIREYASQVANAQDRDSASNLVNDIALETERLGKLVGGFLVGGQSKKAMAAKV
jgi:PAS domain S-box-containing protein